VVSSPLANVSLSASTRLGPYEVLGPLGAGGMGEVYRATATRLEREVALKVLPPDFAADEQRRLRFEREAKAISSLNHPHICTLYDVGFENGTQYLVMELLEGESLADRIAKGPLPPDKVLRYGAQIADALDCAHKNGVVHRDLKPGNVVITRTGAKLLDFGLARAPVDVGVPGEGSNLATTARPLTEQGTIIGTFQYMAPEQLEGQDADARADIFALGTLLFEMATGKRAFEGSSRTSLIAAIVSSQPPPLSVAVPACPPALDHVVRKCLEKDAEDRWQSAQDVAGELRWIAEAGSQAGVAASIGVRRRTREGLAWGLAAVALAAAAWLGLARLAPVPARTVTRTNILLPEKLRLKNAVISPDGSRVVFSGTNASGGVQLWVRPLDSYEATVLSGTDGGVLPFWSPDSRSVGFFADMKLKRVDVAGGVPISLTDVDGIGGAWAPSGDILFTAPSGPVYRLPAGGGKPEPVTALDASRGETGHRYPSLLPDGRHFLYLALNLAGNRGDPANRIWVGSLDGGPAKPLIPANFNAQYADGYLLSLRGGDLGGSLFAQPFDVARLETTGDPIGVVDQMSLYGDYLGLGTYSVSQNGVLVFDAARLLTRLEWFDRAGRQIGSFGDPDLHFNPRLSPDGTQIAFDKYDTGTQTTQIWVGDVARGVQTPLTSGSNSNASPVWSPDGSRIAFQSDRKHQADVYVRQVQGSGSDEALTDEDGQKVPTDWSRDDRFLIMQDREAAGNRMMQLSALPLSGDREPFVLVPFVPTVVSDGRLSPDGHWLVYGSDESGRPEVYVVSFPDGNGRVQISNAGGTSPRWSRGGREILYAAFDGTVTSVAIETSPDLRPATPRPLFPLPEGTSSSWDVTDDGERFVVNVPVTKSSSAPLSVVLDWSADLRR